MTKLNTILPVGIIIALLCMVDFSWRLSANGEARTTTANVIDDTVTKVSFLSDTSRQKLEELLGKFDVKPVPKAASKPASKVAKPKVNLMPKEEQLKQQGKLVDLFDGEDKYSLVATFFDGEKRFGIFTKTHLPTGKATQFRLYENEKLSIYNLTQISNEFVEFSNGSRKIQMRLFLINNN